MNKLWFFKVLKIGALKINIPKSDSRLLQIEAKYFRQDYVGIGLTKGSQLDVVILQLVAIPIYMLTIQQSC